MRGHRKHWVKLFARMTKLMFSGKQSSANLICDSYNQLAAGYDDAWTNHMRDLSGGLIEKIGRIEISPNSKCLDLTCGTGFVTSELSKLVSTRPLGVDVSQGMLDVARKNHGDSCDFKQADILDFLRNTESQTYDVVTCGWGLGYSKPFEVIRNIARVLKTGGTVAIIDNSLFSLAGVILTSVKAFAEYPAALQSVMRVRFIPSSFILASMMRINGLKHVEHWSGSRKFDVEDGNSAIEKMRQTGAAAGFEFAVNEELRQQVFSRFAELLDERFKSKSHVSLTHRYLAAIGSKP